MTTVYRFKVRQTVAQKPISCIKRVIHGVFSSQIERYDSTPLGFTVSYKLAW